VESHPDEIERGGRSWLCWVEDGWFIESERERGNQAPGGIAAK
jgi:hypothetical protein